MAFIPKPQEIYKHFKGNLYQVQTIAEHTETGERLVIYQALYGDYQVYARELSMFTGLVDKEKYPEVTQKFRFELQGGDSARQAEREVCEGVEAQVEKVLQRADEPQEPVVEQQSVDGTFPQSEREAALQDDGNPGIDPLVWEFLDADTYAKRLQILAALHHRITDDMITTMAIACDVEVKDGDIETRYESLKSCLSTLEHYECQRLR